MRAFYDTNTYLISSGEVKDIDKEIYPLVKVLNHWKQRKNLSYTGIATLFSCAGHGERLPYIQFNCSSVQAYFLRIFLKENTPEWRITKFDDIYHLQLRKPYLLQAPGHIKKLTQLLKTKFKHVKYDGGWFVYPNPYTNLGSQISEYSLHHDKYILLEKLVWYVGSSYGKISRKRLIYFLRLAGYKQLAIEKCLNHFIQLGVLSQKGARIVWGKKAKLVKHISGIVKKEIAIEKKALEKQLAQNRKRKMTRKSKEAIKDGTRKERRI